MNTERSERLARKNCQKRPIHAHNNVCVCVCVYVCVCVCVWSQSKAAPTLEQDN